MKDNPCKKVGNMGKKKGKYALSEKQLNEVRANKSNALSQLTSVFGVGEKELGQGFQCR